MSKPVLSETVPPVNGMFWVTDSSPESPNQLLRT